MGYNEKKVFAFLVIALISVMFLTSVSFGDSDRANRGDSGSSIKEGNQGSIYNVDKFLETENRGESLSSKSMNLKKTANARTFLKDYLGVDGDLRSIGKDKSEKNNLEFIYYQQTYSDIPVYNGYFDVVMKNGKIVKVGYNLYDTFSVSLDRKITENQAIEIVLEDIKRDGSREAVLSRERMEINKKENLIRAELFVKDDILVWRVVIPNFVYFVDASTGEILNKETTIREDVYGTVSGAYYPHDPTQAQQYSVFEDDYVFLDNETQEVNTTTNETGFYNLSLDGGSFVITSYLWGPYVNIYNLFQNYSLRNISVVLGDNSWNWTDNDSSDRQEESNVFYHVNLIHDYFKKGEPFNLTHIDYSIPVYVQLDDCNAYYSGSEGIGELDFGNGGGVSGCENLALGSEIIYHEYTHMVSDGIYGSTSFPYSMQTGAMSEGWSDYYACTLTNDSAQGDRILPAGSVRYLNNSLTYPEEWNWEVHDDSRMISAAMWQIRTSVGNETADSLILDSMKMKPQSFTDVLNDLLVVDDDNANLNDGTPNSEDICDAFESHGIVSDYCYKYQGVEHSEYINNTIISIPDSGQYVSSGVTVQEEEGRDIQDLEVYVDISHGRVFDLSINLVSPNGTSVKLYGGSSCGWGIGATSLTKWYDQEYPTDGHDCYSPAEMDSFNGMRDNGTWYLNVTDSVNTGGKTGQINIFELKFYYNLSVNISRGNPVDYYNDTDGNVTFDFKCSSSNTLSVIQLWTNTTGIWHANYSNSSSTNNTWLNITRSYIPDGSYIWGVYCRDSGGNYERTENRTFVVDVATPPMVVLNYPSEYGNLTSLVFNCSATDSGGLKNLSLWMNSTGTWHENETSSISGNSNSSVFIKNLSSDQTYLWNCYACDLQNNCNFSGNKTLVVDESVPNVSLIEPENSHVFAAGTTTITFNWSVEDNYDLSIECSIFTKNIYQTTKVCSSATNCGQEISGFSAGSYTWRVNCSDGANQGISGSRDFSITQAVISGGGGGGGALPPKINITNQTNDSQVEESGSQVTYAVKNLGNIVNPTGLSGMPLSGLGVGDEIYFKIFDQDHSIKLGQVLESSIVLEIRSEPRVVSLDSGESKEFDLNQDGKNDFKLTLSKIFNGKATLILFYLPSEEAGAAEPKKESPRLSWVAYLIIAIVLILVFILITFVKKRSNRGKKRGKNNKKQ
jgi:Zn-dependent metalloprotease/subtilisin-like proprotein convertase family protein